MSQIKEFINNITMVQLIDIWLAVGIIFLFQILKSAFAYIIIRILKLKADKPKEIKQSSLYEPLKAFFSVLGIYLAILFLKQPLNINASIMNITTEIFKIVVIITTAAAFAKSLNPKSTLVKTFKNKSEKDIEDSLMNFILKLARGVIYIAAGFLVITELGFNLNGLVAGLGISGVIITLAAQDTAKNLFGGLVIFLDKPFTIGEWIQVKEYEGNIEDITFRSTRLRTFENSIVNIPNSVIAESSIINWSRMEKRRCKINLVLEIDTPLNKVEKVKSDIYKMLQDKENVIDETIIVRFDEITDNGIDLLIYAYTDCTDYPSFLAAKENINYKIMQILKNENVELAYNTQTIQIRK